MACIQELVEKQNSILWKTPIAPEAEKAKDEAKHEKEANQKNVRKKKWKTWPKTVLPKIQAS